MACKPEYKILGIRSAVATSFTLSSHNEKKKCTRSVQCCHPFTLHPEHSWQQILDGKVMPQRTHKGILKPSPYQDICMMTLINKLDIRSAVQNVGFSRIAVVCTVLNW